MSDKKNENKKVDVEDFLPAEAAIEAIKYSMWASSLYNDIYMILIPLLCNFSGLSFRSFSLIFDDYLLP